MKKFASAIAVLVIATLLIFVSSCKKDESNNNPVITSVTVSSPSVESGSVVTVTVVASDPDGDALTYTYVVSGGAIQGNGATATWTAPSIAGSYSVTVTVTDGNGGSVSGNGSLTVVEAPTQITGTAFFPAGTSGDLSNAKVSIYTSVENWEANTPVEFGSVVGAGASVTFTLGSLNPGNYYLDVWKDNDNNASWSTGDFVGWHGSGGLGSEDLTEIQLAKGETKNIDIKMYIIEGAATGSVTGTATLLAGTAGDLANSVIGLYESFVDFPASPYASAIAVGSGTSVDFGFDGIEPGAYYVGLWKDSNGNSAIDISDFVGWYGTGDLTNWNPVQINVEAGLLTEADFTVFLIEDVQASTSVEGTLTIAGGGAGDLSDTYVFLYTSYENYQSFNYAYVVTTTGSGTSVTYAFGEIDPGNYYIDAWTDTDGNQDFSAGDFYGVWEDLGTGFIDEFTVDEGSIEDISFPMYLLTDKSGEKLNQEVRKTVTRK